MKILGGFQNDLRYLASIPLNIRTQTIYDTITSSNKKNRETTACNTDVSKLLEIAKEVCKKIRQIVMLHYLTLTTEFFQF